MTNKEVKADATLPNDATVMPKKSFKEILLLIWTKFLFGLKYFWREAIKYPTYILFHPIKGYDRFKREKRAKFGVALGMLIAAIVVNIFSYRYTGFEFTNKDIRDLSVIAETAYLAAPILIFVVANWSVTTIANGKGTMKEIFMFAGYALFPLVIANTLVIFFSNVLTGSEKMMIMLISRIGLFLTGYMLFFGIMIVHEYGFLQAVGVVVITFVAMAIVIFALLLFFNLFQQMYGFAHTIYQEITLRGLL